MNHNEEHNMPYLKVIKGDLSDISLDPLSDMYYEAMKKIYYRDVDDYLKGKIEHDKLYGSLQILSNVMAMTKDEIALAKLQKLYDECVHRASLD